MYIYIHMYMYIYIYTYKYICFLFTHIHIYIRTSFKCLFPKDICFTLWGAQKIRKGDLQCQWMSLSAMNMTCWVMWVFPMPYIKWRIWYLAAGTPLHLSVPHLCGCPQVATPDWHFLFDFGVVGMSSDQVLVKVSKARSTIQVQRIDKKISGHAWRRYSIWERQERKHIGCKSSDIGFSLCGQSMLVGTGATIFLNDGTVAGHATAMATTSFSQVHHGHGWLRGTNCEKHQSLFKWLDLSMVLFRCMSNHQWWTGSQTSQKNEGGFQGCSPASLRGPHPVRHWGHREIEDLVNHTVPRQLEDRAMVERYVAWDGRRRVKGGKDLKRSQAYPRQNLAI